MIVVRDVFQIDPEQMKQAKELARQGREFERKLGYPVQRILTDLTGEYYTLVMESQFESLGAFEAALRSVFANTEWQKNFTQFRKCIRGGRREVFTVVE